MIRLEEQQDLFSLIGEKLKKKVECFVIGGSAMIYYKAKDATKDIDIVFLNENDRKLIIDILKELGYKEREAKILYFRKKNVPILLQRGEERFDLFCDKIISFKFTESMKERITSVYEYNNLIIKLVSPEDIILLKCATERAGDRLDAAELIKRANINWDAIINESINQMNLIGDIIPLSLYDFLSELKEDLKANIPDKVINKIEDIAYKETVKKIKSGKHIKITHHKKKKIIIKTNKKK